MKILKCIGLCLFAMSLNAQSDEEISLEWKISKDTLKYKTTMKQTSEEISQETPADTASVFSNTFQKLKQSLNDINSNIKYQTNLFINKQNQKWIDIEMIIAENNSTEPDVLKVLIEQEESTKNKKSSKDKKKSKQKNIELDSIPLTSVYKSLAGMNKNIVLRGRISNTGEIISKYYKTSQTNLIALLFELPNKKVKIGEKWKLDVRFIEMDQNFFCDSTSTENSVYIEKIIKNGNEQIAVIKYDLSEYVIGDFTNQMGGIFGNQKNKKTFMKMSHIATGNFSITQGKWITYEGITEIESNFLMSAGKTKTQFSISE